MAGDHTRRMVNGADEFSRNFHKALSDEKEGDLVCSPMSALLALGMAQVGARGKTAKVMAAGLSMPSDPIAAQECYEELIQAMADVEEAELNLANKSYIKKDFILQQSYQKSLKTFEASIEKIDFVGKSAEKKINSWVAKKTKDKIKDLFGPGSFDGDTRMVLVNAVFFKGTWLNQFEKSETRKMDFYQKGNKKMKAPFMHQIENFNYANSKDLDAQILELPYQGNELSLFVFLPNKKTGLAKLEEELATMRMRDLMRMFEKVQCTLYLPKFKIESTLDLAHPLHKMGMGNIFADSADFSGISTSDEALQISNVIQKALIEITEEGTIAAAATRVIVRKVRGARPATPKKQVTFRADHPFMFSLVLDHSEGPIVLFTGRVSALAKSSDQEDD